MCLVVAGRYVRGLEYFDVLLGDRPALPPDVRLYQRLLASDFVEGAAVLAKAAEEGPLEAVSDGVLLPMLRRLASDDQRDLVPDAMSAGVREGLEELLDDLLEKGEAPGFLGRTARALRAGPRRERRARRALAGQARRDARSAPARSRSSSELVSEIVKRIAEKTARRRLHQRAHPALARPRSASVQAPRGGENGERELVVGLWAAPAHELAERPQDAGPRTLWIATAAELLAALENARARWRARPRARALATKHR